MGMESTERGGSFRATRRWGDWSLLAALAITSLVLGVNIHRAITQSITHDEALTYHMFLTGKDWTANLRHILLRFTATNHILHTYLCLFSIKIFGLSAFTMRLPSLCGGAIYLFAGVQLCRVLYGRGLVFLSAVCLMTLNPFVLDYLSLARGYGLALGFYTWALLVAARGLCSVWSGNSPSLTPAVLWKVSLLLALAVLSNLTFLLASFSLAVLWALLLLTRWSNALQEDSGRSRYRQLFRYLVLPGLTLFCLLGLAPLGAARSSDFYFGEATIKPSIAGLVTASLAHHRSEWPWDTASPEFVRAIEFISTWGAGLLAAGMVIGTLYLACKPQSPKSPDSKNQSQFLLLLGSTLLMTVALIAALHLTLGVKYPSERSGIYLVPLVTLSVMSMVSVLIAGRPPARICGGIVLAGCWLVVGQFALQFHTSYYRTWQYDSASERIFAFLEQEHARHPGKKIRVVTSWVLVPSLAFYRVTHGSDWIETIEAEGASPGDHDYYVESYLAPLRKRPAHVVFSDEVAGALVATEPSPSGK